MGGVFSIGLIFKKEFVVDESSAFGRNNKKESVVVFLLA